MYNAAAEVIVVQLNIVIKMSTLLTHVFTTRKYLLINQKLWKWIIEVLVNFVLLLFYGLVTFFRDVSGWIVSWIKLIKCN